MFHQEHECLVEGPLNNLKQSMVQFQKPKKVGDGNAKVDMWFLLIFGLSYLFFFFFERKGGGGGLMVGVGYKL